MGFKIIVLFYGFLLSKVITTLIDEVCPKSVNTMGLDIPVHPTVFSGDNKTEGSLQNKNKCIS